MKNYYKDELFPDAVEVTLETRCVSAARLQTNLRIGSIRAGKLITEMEEHGIIGPERGARPREIFFTRERWEAEKDDFVCAKESTMTDPEPEPREIPKGKDICPHCGLLIPKSAFRCIHCKKKIPHNEAQSKDLLGALVIVFIMFALLFDISINNSAPSTSSKQTPDALIYTDGEIDIYASGIYYGKDYPTVKFLVENNTGENIRFACSTFVVDDVMMDSVLWIDVAEGAKATGTLYLDGDVLGKAGFDRVSRIKFYEPHISFKESGRDTKYISLDMALKNVAPRSFDTSGNVLYSRNGVTVISRFEPGRYSRTIPLLIINESGRDITPWTSHVTVNGYTVSEWHYGAAIENNAARYFDIQLVKEDMEDIGISTINSASFTLDFLEAGSTRELFSAGQLYVK